MSTIWGLQASLADVTAIGGLLVAAVLAYAALKFKVEKNSKDINGVSGREAENTKKAHRMLILRLASDIDAVAADNREVQRLTALLRKAVE